MRSVVCHQGDLDVADLPEPTPGRGQLLIEVSRCGICGSDLHARHHADAQADILAEVGYHGFMRVGQRVVLGHEFTGTIADVGPRTGGKLRAGTPVVAMPLIRHDGEMHAVGLSASAPGAYAERVVVEEAFTFPVPNGLSPDVAVLTEPVAVAHHAVRRAGVSKKDATVVIGCGPVGLAVICVLRATGVDTIVASDHSPARRALAWECGATTVVDPGAASPWAALDGRGFTTSITQATAGGLKAMRQLRQLPVPWEFVYRVVDKLGVTDPKRPIIFECVGAPGVLDDVIAQVPLASRVIVAGVCMEPDRIRPAMAINKEIDLRFVVGYTPLEFRDTLHMLADGTIDAGPIVTGTVGLDGVATAFDVLADPGEHAKLVIDPHSAATAPQRLRTAR